jgi:hypothetical protein
MLVEYISQSNRQGTSRWLTLPRPSMASDRLCCRRQCGVLAMRARARLVITGVGQPAPGRMEPAAGTRPGGVGDRVAQVVPPVQLSRDQHLLTILRARLEMTLPTLLRLASYCVKLTGSTRRRAYQSTAGRAASGSRWRGSALPDFPSWFGDFAPIFLLDSAPHHPWTTHW